MNIAKQSWLVDLVSLLFFTALTVVAIIMKEITVFFVIYIFWWDEVIKTLFDWIRYYFHPNQIKDADKYKVVLYARIFMLAIYLVFIIVCFCFMFEGINNDGFVKNIQVLFFKNTIFNISLISFVGREAFNYVIHKNPTELTPDTVLPKGALTLHISIILGMFAWFLTSNKFFQMPLGLEKYTTLFTIAPFILIKFLFDWSSLKVKDKTE